VTTRILQLVIVSALFAGFLCCEREDRILRQPPPADETFNSVQISGLNPGGNPAPSKAPANVYEESAYTVSEGQKLFDQYNCSGCHAHGGGGIGPPLMDNNWIYGSEPGNIFATITQGRPNGMPSFRNRIPEYQVWELVAYVRSLSGLLPKDVSPSRSDRMNVKPSESSMPMQSPNGITGAPEARQ